MSDSQAKVDSVAVLGAGTMGSGIAQIFAATGAKVRLFDVELGRIEQARAQIKG